MANTSSKLPSSAHPLFILLYLVILLLARSSNAQKEDPTLFKGYQCAANRSIYPCQAFALYRADVSGSSRLTALDLPSVGDIFDVSRLMVAKASNLTTSANISQAQPLLIPLTCTCTDNHSYALVPYQIVSGDTFYLLSTSTFGNLTTYPAVELVNPTLVPTDLQIGVITIFPIFCKCLDNSSVFSNSSSNSSNPLALVTYVLQPSDSYSSVASDFGTDVQTLISLNGPETGSNITNFSTIFVPLYQTTPPLLANFSTTATAPSSPPEAPPSTTTTRERKGLITGLAVALGVLGALLLLQLLLLACCWSRFSSKGGWRKEDAAGEQLRIDSKLGQPTLGGLVSEDDKLITDISVWLDKYKVFKIEELRQATSDFDRSRLLQGTVYKGMIGEEVFAIKKMKWNACDELKILQKVNHTNLVKLEGFCIDADAGTCYLVYEFVENGSLDSWLHDSTASGKLDWRARLHIAIDLANGLQYIHEHTWPRVVHKDIKSSNVLLDSNFRAKIANFGLAKSGCNAVTTHIIGTQGYIAPEYLTDGLVSTKVDVFAYGVVLLELISGKEAANEEGETLWSEVDRMFRRNDERIEEWITTLMDPVLLEQSFARESVVGVLKIARACLQKNPAKRPSMVDVAYALSKADELFSDFSGEGFSVGAGDVVGR